MSSTATGGARLGRRVVYRVQDREGRGPWRPGLSDRWVEPRPDHKNLQPWFVEFGPQIIGRWADRNYGCACASLDQLRRWFSLSEYATLRLLGFQAVQMRVDRVLAESDRQLVFARSIPLAYRVEPVELYARETAPCS